MAKSDQPRAPSRNKKTVRKRLGRRSGTALAIIDIIQSCGFNAAGSGWGGARNSADRTSQNLTRQQCEALMAAADHAEVIGLPFNRHWTVHYERAGIAEQDATRFIGHLLKLAREYAARKYGKFTAIWVRENGDSKGGHVHILMHLATTLSLRGRTRRWIGLAGGKCERKVSKIVAIGGRLKSADIGGEHYRQNIANVRVYLTKGASAAVGDDLGLVLSGNHGLIVGKRCGWTQNLGMATRRRICTAR